MRLFAPSVLSADFLNLEKDILQINECADLFHLDIMDGVFVPNISFGFPVMEALMKKAKLPVDVHLMITDPGRYVERFAKAGAGMISFHLEAVRANGTSPADLLAKIRSLGIRAGIVINPDISVQELYPVLPDADFVLIMSVFAGFGGQKFIETTYERVKALSDHIKISGLNCTIEVDGGINRDNVDKLHECGAEIFVAGSSFFNAEDRLGFADAIKGRI